MEREWKARFIHIPQSPGMWTARILVLLLLVGLCVPAFSVTLPYIIESRSGGQNYANYTDSSFADSTGYVNAPGCTNNIGSRYTDATKYFGPGRYAQFSFTPDTTGYYAVDMAWPGTAGEKNAAVNIYTGNPTGGPVDEWGNADGPQGILLHTKQNEYYTNPLSTACSNNTCPDAGLWHNVTTGILMTAATTYKVGLYAGYIAGTAGPDNPTASTRVAAGAVKFSIATPGQVTYTWPTDGATNIPAAGIGNELTWAVGANASSYDVYFGTDQNLVTNGDASVKVASDITANTWDPPDLTVGQWYYWRIDGKNLGIATAGSTVYGFQASSNTAYALTGLVSTAGGGTVSGPAFAIVETPQPSVTWTATPDSTHYFVKWTTDDAFDSTLITTDNPRVWAPSGDETFYAQFMPIPTITGLAVDKTLVLDTSDVNVSWTANNADHSKLQVDGGAWTDPANLAGEVISTGSLGYGAHTVTVKAVDALGYEGPASSVTFTVDRSSIRHWDIIGHYAWDTGTAAGSTRWANDFFAPANSETNARAKTGLSYVSSVTPSNGSWQEYTQADERKVDLNRFYNSSYDSTTPPSYTEYGVSYLFTYVINSGDAISNAHVACGSDDGIKVWFNGAYVGGSDVYRGCNVDANVFPATPDGFTINPGPNALLIKVTQGGGGYQVQARLCDSDGTTKVDPAWLSQITYAVSDTTAPTPGSPAILINGGATTGQSYDVTLTLSATDDLSGVDAMLFSDDGYNWQDGTPTRGTTPVPYTTTYAYTLPEGLGDKTVYVKFIDKCGNETSGTDSATITLSGYQLTLYNCDTGAGTPTGGGGYAGGASVTVHANTNPGYTFTGWTMDGCGGGIVASTLADYTFIMPDYAYQLFANYSVNSYTLTANANTGGTATITDPLPGGTSESVPTNTSCTVVATPTPGVYTFKNWTTTADGSGTPVSTSATYTFPMPPSNYTLYANFTPIPVLTVAKTPPAGGTVGGGGTFPGGTPVTVTASPATNFVFQYWTTGLPGSATVVSRKRNYSFNMPSSDYTITAVFTKAMFAEGWEGLADDTVSGVNGCIDMNDTHAGPNNGVNGDTNPNTFFNPWWGTAPQNGYSISSDTTYYTTAVVPHVGSRQMYGYAGNGRDYLNLAYRANGNSPLMGNFFVDWYFFDGLGTVGTYSGASTTYVCDPLSVAYMPVLDPLSLPAGTEFPASATSSNFYTTEQAEGTVFTQKLSLGCANDIATGFDKTKYQARIAVEPAGTSTAYVRGWYNLSKTRSVGWHHARILIGPQSSGNMVSYYIDDMTAPLLTKTSPTTVGFNALEILTEWRPVGITGWGDSCYFDDISVGVPGTQSIDAYNVIGPYSYTDANTRLTTDYFAAGPEGKTEATIWPSTGKTYNGKTWQLYKGGDMIDFTKFFSPAPTTCATYLATYINNSGAAITDADLTMGSDDGIQVILNGSQVFNDNSARGIMMDAVHYGPFTLNPGVNKLMFKVVNGTSGYAAQARLTHTDGTPLTGVTYFTSEDVPPSGTIQINGGASSTAVPDVTLTLSATDDLSGVDQMQFSDDGVTYGTPVAYATTYPHTLPGPDGTKMVYVKFIDNAGNVSSAASASILLSTVPPCSVPPGSTDVGKISSIWALPNDATLYKLSAKTVTATWTDGFWVEDTDRSAAIKVLYPGDACTIGSSVTAGCSVDVYGTLSTGDTRVITASVVSNLGAAPALLPVRVVEKYSGGKGVNVTTPAVTGGKGIYGVGLFVKLSGSLTQTGGDWYLDDGSGLLDGSIKGMKVISLTTPTAGNEVVTGVIGIQSGKPVIYATDIQ